MSGNVKITNAVYVHRLWSDAGTELLAVFQYEGEASDYAERMIASDAARQWFGSSYATFNSYDGSLKIFSQPAPKAEAAGAKQP